MPGLLRQRLSTFYGLLAARSDLWIDLSRRIYGNLATLAARMGVIGNIEITFHETRKSTSARHNADLEVSTYQPLAIGIYIAQYKRWRVVAMNRRSSGYLVSALNQLASLTARCGLKNICRPVQTKALTPIDGSRRNPGRQCGVARRAIGTATRHQDRPHGKRMAS
jgi:hypothetical protein